MYRVFIGLRNLFCNCLAVAVIASGRARQAKHHVLSSNVVTAIYFHNPNRRLFAQCIRWLTKNGYTFISADELIQILYQREEAPRGAVWLSFDDGFKELLQNVIPLSHQRKIPITIFIPSGIVAGDGLFPWLHQAKEADGAEATESAPIGIRDSITEADLKEMARYPEVTIGSHTVGHIVTLDLTDEQARYEFRESKRALESWTGRTVKTFAYPEGRLSGRERPFLAECGYHLAATTEAALVTRQNDPYFVPRFHVGDIIWFPEAICNMVGVWRPAIDPILHVFQSGKNMIQRLRHSTNGQYHMRRPRSL